MQAWSRLPTADTVTPPEGGEGGSTGSGYFYYYAAQVATPNVRIQCSHLRPEEGGRRAPHSISGFGKRKEHKILKSLRSIPPIFICRSQVPK